MFSRHFDIYQINESRAEPINQVDFELDLTGHGEHMHLKHLIEVDLRLWPLDLLLLRRGHLKTIYQ